MKTRCAVTLLFAAVGLGTLSADSQLSIDYESEWQSPVPAGLGIGANQHVVAPSSFNEVYVYDRIGTSLMTFGDEGTAESQFKGPRDAAVSDDGSMFIVDMFNHRVQKFDSTGNFIFMWGFGVATGANTLETCFENCLPGIPGNQPGQLNGPEGITIDSSGYVYVADTQGNFRIQKYDSNGNFVTNWKSDFSYPVRVASGPFGDVYVADTNNNRVQRFDSNGSFVSAWGWGVNTGAEQYEICTDQVNCLPGLRGGGAGQFYYPRGIGVDTKGNVYVAGNLNHRVQIFDSAGGFLVALGWGVDTGTAQFENCYGDCQKGIAGHGPGQMYTPDDVAVNKDGELFVSNKDASRIQRFASTAMVVACQGFEPPMADHPVTAKKNRAFPLKMQLFDLDGYEVTGVDVTAAPLVEVLYTATGSQEAFDVTDDLLSVGLGTEGNRFVYIAEDNMWKFNLKSTNYTGSGTYVVTAISGAPDEYVLDPSCVTSFEVK